MRPERLLGLVGLGMGSCTPARPLPPPQSPDIIVFSVDTLRADRLGFTGHTGAITPHLDGFAAEARVFSEATTPLTRTTPALASLLSGLDPRGHGSWEVGAPIQPDVPLLAEVLQGAGWATLAMSGTPVASPKQGLGRGCDRFEVLEDPPASELVALALQAVAEVDAARPVFLWVHVTDPHFPYEGSANTPLCDALGRSFRERPRQRWRIFANADGRSEAALSDCQKAYDAEVHQVDDAFGQLLAGLGPRADGLFVVTADHGENQGEGGLWYEHGPDVADATLRVPLLLRGPGIPPGPHTRPARLQDVAPTVLPQIGATPPPAPVAGTDLLAEPGPAAAVGVSASALHVGLTGYLRSGREKKRSCLNVPDVPVSWCTDGAFDRHVDPALQTAADPPTELAARLRGIAERWPPEQTRQWTARTADWKLTATPVPDGGFAYRLTRASDEWGPDHSAEQPEVRARLQASLVEDSTGAAVPSPAQHATEGAGLSPVDDAALRTLGYIE